MTDFDKYILDYVKTNYLVSFGLQHTTMVYYFRPKLNTDKYICETTFCEQLCIIFGCNKELSREKISVLLDLLRCKFEEVIERYIKGCYLTLSTTSWVLKKGRVEITRKNFLTCLRLDVSLLEGNIVVNSEYVDYLFDFHFKAMVQDACKHTLGIKD